MELKRYALLNDNRVVEIYKKEKFGYSYVDEVINDIVCTRSILISDVKKTSDNILDLVEVGDLVEIKDSPYLHRVYEQIYKGLNNQVLSFIYMTIHSTGQYLLSEVNKDVIISIYKRQSNGDYKKHEVK